MFKITIEGATLQELMANVNAMAAGADMPVTESKPKPRKAASPAPEPDPVEAAISHEDAAVLAELNAEVEPAPETANSVVDAGTGKPLVADAPVQMTKADVKAAAVKLAGKDTPALAAILKKYDAPNLSGVSDENLGDFAADVMAALG